jgi:hypothetical protein
LFGSSDVWKEDQKILAITSHVSWTKKKTDVLEKTKKLKFYWSLMSTTLIVMSWGRNPWMWY